MLTEGLCPAFVLFPRDLKEKLFSLFRQIQDGEFDSGEEHSRFVDAALSSGASTTSVFMDEGRFDGKIILRDFLGGEGKHSGLPGFNLPKAFLGDPRIFDLRCFAGREGHSSSLHFDWNSSGVYIINVHGEKIFRLYSPERSAELPGYSNFFLGHPPEPDFTFTLETGDVLFIPPFWWHQAVYHSAACSFSLRFGGEDILFWKKHIYPSWKLVDAFHSRPEQLHQFARKLFLVDDIDRKFSLIESKTRFADVRDQKYDLWSKGYLTYMKLELKHRLILR